MLQVDSAAKLVAAMRDEQVTEIVYTVNSTFEQGLELALNPKPTLGPTATLWWTCT